jgi:hypothetical protein
LEILVEKLDGKNGSWGTIQELEGKCYQYMKFNPYPVNVENKVSS